MPDCQKKPKINHMLILSTGHVYRKTLDRLKWSPEDAGKTLGLGVYQSDGFGVIVQIPENLDDTAPGIPRDLLDCLRFAQYHGCDMLCLRNNGQLISPDILRSY